MSQRAITSRDVARTAGVSQATVSAVLNGTRFVSDETRNRVEAAIAQLNYRPNALARSLKTQASRLIGLVLPTLVSPWWSGVVGAIDKAALAEGYSIILAQTENDAAREVQIMRTLLEHQVVGFIVVPSYQPDPELVQLIGSGVPVVLLNRPIPGVELDLLGLDSYGDARLAVEHLIGHGRRRVATLLQPMRTPASREHLRGYQEATRAAGLPDDLFRETGVGSTDGESATRALFERDPGIDALFCSSHLLTIGAYAALESLGRRIPDDVAIIGQNDLPWTSQLRSPLSVLHQSDQEFGTQAVRLLMDRLADPTGARRQVVCPERLILRHSCGCPWPREKESEAAA
jgi:LacI family transcriptional regulator